MPQDVTLPRVDSDGLCAGRRPVQVSPSGWFGVCEECGQDRLEVDESSGEFRWAHLPMRADAPS